MPKKSKNLYSQYEKSRLDEAVKSYVSGKLSLRKASIQYEIPRSTISDHALNKVKPNTSSGRPQVIPKEVEQEIVNETINASEKGLGLSRLQLMLKAGQVCKTLKIKTPFKNGIPGKDWLSGVRHRHPELTLRRPVKLSASRSTLNAEKVNEYFQLLEKVITENSLSDPSHIWNMDEKGIRIEHKPQSVLSRKGSRSVLGKVSNCRDNVTIVASVNAAGKRMPPLLIVKGTTCRSLYAYDTEEGPADAVWTYQSNAWIEDILGQKWFEEVFFEKLW